MSSQPRVPAATNLLVDEQVDIVGFLRHALERRAFVGACVEAVPRLQGPRRVAHFFEATSFMETDPQRLGELVITLLGAAHVANMEVVLWLHGERDGVRFRYAVLQPEGRAPSSMLGPNFQRMLESAFPGVALHSMPSGAGESLTRDLIGLTEHAACGLLLGIPSERKDTPVETRLDDVLNGLAGRPFDVLVQVAPATPRDVDVAEDNLAYVVNLAHQLTKQQLSVSESESFSESVARGMTTSWSRTETTSWSTSDSSATSKQVKGHMAQRAGTAAGAMVGGLIGAAVGAPSGPGAAATAAAGAKVGAILGGVMGSAIGGMLVPPVQETKTTSKTDSNSTAKQTGGGESETTTTGVANQWGRAVSVERLNRQAGLIGELAELHLQRARQMQSFGAWHVSIHLATGNDSDLELASSLLAGALRGETTHLESLKVVHVAPDAVQDLLVRAAAFSPANFLGVRHVLIPRGEQPSTLLSSEELAHWFRPPSSPVVGVDVRPQVSFGVSVSPPARQAAPSIRLGNLIAGGRTLSGVTVDFATTDLLRHCFVAGTTGAGKTTTVRCILLQLAEQGVPFLVVEPAKTEYRELFAELVRSKKRPLRLTLRGGDTPDDRRLRLNPWRVPSGAILGRHVEGMKLLLRSCFAMQESLPQILERAVFDIYSECGWTDLAEIVPSPPPHRFPTFADFVAPGEKGAQSFLQRTVRALDYRAEATGNLTAAITVRLQSFTRGLKSHLFGEEDGQLDEIFARPTFIELGDLNEPDIKRFLLGALVLRLASELEVRHRARPLQEGIHHVIVLEEAHQFLRDAVGYGPGAELARESNTLLADAFAEMRGFGEGIIVADQAPAELSPAVLRNTNLKIAHRLLYEQDCVAMGNAMGLDDAQRQQLRALRPGECVVHGPAFNRPVQCRVLQEGH
jgi:outer membrane lipoprotein SlyB